MTRQRSERKSSADICLAERLSWLGLTPGDDGLVAAALKTRITTRDIGEILRLLLTCGCSLELTSSARPRLLLLRRSFKYILRSGGKKRSLKITAGARICGEKYCLDILFAEETEHIKPIVLRVVPRHLAEKKSK